jgi:hypothetical protein
MLNKFLQKFYRSKAAAVESMHLYVSEHRMLPGEQGRRMDKTEMFFIKAVAGYKISDFKRNEDVRRSLEITG